MLRPLLRRPPGPSSLRPATTPAWHPRGPPLAACCRHRRALSAAQAPPPNDDARSAAVPAEPDSAPAAAPAAPKGDEPMDPAEFRRQQEAAGYIMRPRRKSASPLSDYAPQTASVQAQAPESSVDLDQIAQNLRNASAREDDETHARFEHAMTIAAGIALALFLMVSFGDIRNAITGNHPPEIQTELSGEEAKEQARSARVAAEKRAVRQAVEAAKQRREQRSPEAR